MNVGYVTSCGSRYVEHIYESYNDQKKIGNCMVQYLSQMSRMFVPQV